MNALFPITTRRLLELRGGPSGEGDLVSVAVSLHNYEGLITRSLDSVAAQQHPRLELIVVDDASTDASAEVAREWLERSAHRFERVLLIAHDENEGLAQTRNTGFEAAEGEYVFALDADNEIYPRAIGRLLESARSGGFALAYSQVEFFGAETRLGYADLWRRELLASANYVDAMALISKTAWAQVGGYAHLDLGWEDFDLWCRFVEHRLEGVYVPEILCRYRIHPASMLRTTTDLAEGRIVDTLSVRHPWLKLLAGPG